MNDCRFEPNYVYDHLSSIPFREIPTCVTVCANHSIRELRFPRQKPDMTARFGDLEPGTHPVVFRLSSLGDVVLITGVLEHWFQSYGLRFTVITRSEYVPVFQGHPSVESVVGLRSDHLKGSSWYRTARQLAHTYRNRALIDLHGSFRSHILSFLWSGTVYRYPKFNIERRLYLKRHSLWLKRRLLSANIPQRYARALDKKTPPLHDVVPRIFLSEDERENAVSILEQRHISSPCIVLHPYTSFDLKAWPETHWNTLVERIRKAGIDWIVVGRSVSRFFHELEPARDLTNHTDIRTTCALMANAHAVVSCDSGPVHLADAVSSPVIALYGPTIREWGFFPSGPQAVIVESDLPCRPCSLHGNGRCSRAGECMNSITPELVFDALISVVSMKGQ